MRQESASTQLLLNIVNGADKESALQEAQDTLAFKMTE